MIPFHTFLGDEYLGQGLRNHAFSDHYLCPACGTIWARNICDGQSQHHSWSVYCPEHERTGLYSPPCISDWETRYDKIIWPIEVLVRDFLFLVEKREQFIANNQPRFPVEEFHP